jgi:hypothetical protein
MEAFLQALYAYLIMSTAISLAMVVSIFLELEKEPPDSSDQIYQLTNRYPHLSTIGAILICIVIWPWIVMRVMESIDVVSNF